MKKYVIMIVALIFLGGAAFGLGQSESGNQSSKSGVKVFVSVLPQTYFVEKIGGDRVSAEVVVPPGKNPATYEPTPNQVASLSTADVLFTIGLPFEKAFLPKISESLKSLKIVDSAEGIEKRSIVDHHHEEDEHHDGEEEDEEHGEAEPHGALDPHVWLSPLLVKIQAANIHRSLVEIDPAGKSVYDAGLADLINELDVLHSKLSLMLAPYKGRILFIFHPTLGYFADEYGLEQVAIEVGGKQPSAAELVEIIKHANEEEVKIIFVQPEFPQDSAALIAKAINGSVVGLNPLDPDYINNMEKIAESIRKSYE